MSHGIPARENVPDLSPSECTIIVAIQTYEDGKFKLRGRHGYTVYKDVIPFYEKVCEAMNNIYKTIDDDDARKEFFSRFGRQSNCQAGASEDEPIQK